jgi:hypothetical protein
MGSNFTSLTVTWYNESSGYTASSNITSDISAIPLFTDTGSGEVNECELVLNAKGGNYITTGNIIDKYDRIRIQITDLLSNNYDRYFEVINITPSQTKTEGSLLTLSCVGIEYHTQVIHYARRDWFENAFDVAQKIGEAYELNIGSRQPTIARHTSTYSTTNAYGNDLPKWTNNHYEFGASEDSCYNRWLDLTTLLGGAVTNGGVGDFFELGFDTPSVITIDMALFTSGKRTFDGNNPSNDSSAVVIENTTSINVSEQEGGISNPTGTKSAAWGSPSHGSLPVGFSKYAGNELEFSFRPQWSTGVTYKVGARVLGTDSKHYEVKTSQEHLSESDRKPITGVDWATYWKLIDHSDVYGDSVKYSEWTDDKAILWANAGANPDAVSSIPAWGTGTAYTIGDLVSNSGNQYVATKKHTSGTLATDITNGKFELVDSAKKGNGAAFFDTNVVVRDDGIMFRTWVNEAVGDTDYNGVADQTLSNEYRHLTQDSIPIGHRFLNIGTTGALLRGSDQRGKPFTNAVVQWINNKGVGDTGQYEVLYEQPTSTLDKMQVFDIKDRKMWEWDNTTSKWEDKTSVSPYRNDECAHEWKSIYNINGSDPRPSATSTSPFNEDSSTYNTNIRSAVEVCYQFTTVVHDFVSSTSDAKKGAWLNFGFPFPLSTYNGISEGVGDIYGGGTNEKASLVTHPSLLDTQNMTWTSDGKIGFNHSTSEELGPLSSLALNMRVSIDDVNGNKLGGVVQVRCFIIDVFDNIVTQDFEMRFTDYIGTGKGFQSVNLPLSGFTSFRGRVPKNWSLRWASTILGISIPIQELDVQDVFNEHSIKYIGFQINDFYDDEGRYDPQRNLQEMTNIGTFIAGGGTIRMAIDAFHFKKVLLAISGQPSVQNIEPEFLQRPNIMSYQQLKNEVNSQLEIEQFRHKEFNFQTSGNSIFDIRFGDTFFLKNTELVSDADKGETNLGDGDGTTGTIRLVAKRIEYHLTKPSNGPGGITRSIKGVKRFVI